MFTFPAKSFFFAQSFDFSQVKFSSIERDKASQLLSKAKGTTSLSEREVSLPSLQRTSAY